jgi:hypothetical protein
LANTPSDTARWTVSVSKETDAALRAFLGAQGMRKGDISKYAEEAVRWRMFDQTVQEIRARNADVSAEDLMAAIDDACASVRAASQAARA